MVKDNPDNELKVFILTRDSACGECNEELGKGRWATLAGDKGALCLSCADIDHLEFLPSGDAALTRRSRKHSVLSAIVLKWSRSRKRYERQGLLVEESALEKAEEECLADAEVRERRKERESIRREGLDKEYIKQFAGKIRELFPNCPPDREIIIAEHACRKYSNRIGRSEFAKQFDEGAIRLAVIAHIRHRETNYDELLGKGYLRGEARATVETKIMIVLRSWEIA